MKYFRVSENKIKVSLSVGDMELYGLSKKDETEMGKEAQAAFFRILSDIAPASRFEVGEDRMLLQFYVRLDGTGELFATKLPGKRQKPEGKRAFMRFDDGEKLRAALACGALRLPDTVYRLKDAVYFPLSASERAKYPAIPEYGGREVSWAEEAFVKEHGKLTPPSFFDGRGENEEEAKE